MIFASSDPRLRHSLNRGILCELQEQVAESDFYYLQRKKTFFRTLRFALRLPRIHTPHSFHSVPFHPNRYLMHIHALHFLLGVSFTILSLLFTPCVHHYTSLSFTYDHPSLRTLVVLTRAIPCCTVSIHCNPKLFCTVQDLYREERLSKSSTFLLYTLHSHRGAPRPVSDPLLQYTFRHRDALCLQGRTKWGA